LRHALSSVAGVNPDDERAFSAFVQERGTHLLRYARLLIPDDGEAEDALQTALLRLTRHWSRQLNAPEPYVRRTLVNLATDRGRRRHLVAEPAPPAQPDASSPDHAEALAARDELDAVLLSLPPRQRAAVVLRAIEGLTELEAAAVMGTSVGAIKSNFSRGLAKCRAALASTTTGTP
jgi:RNA polymerase sigma-70 factor (sigma-E family)